MQYEGEYAQKLTATEDAAKLVKSGMWIDLGFFMGIAYLMEEEIAERADELEDVKIRTTGFHLEPQTVKADPEQKHFIFNDFFIMKRERRYYDMGCLSHIPFNFHDEPRVYREFLKDEVDIAFMEVTPMDRGGYFNFGVGLAAQKAICDVAKTVVVEVNRLMPWVPGGYDESIHISDVDFIVENEKYEIPELGNPDATDVDKKIAENVAPLIENGSTIQLGIGGMPNIIGQLLIEHGKKDLGIHTEMFTDSMADLIEEGVVTGKKKSLNPGKAVHCFAAGSRRMYDFMDHNISLAGFPVDYTNDPYIISQNEKQVAINSAIVVDLTGQVCSETAGYRHISGTGGQLDFTLGAYMSKGGKAFTCLHSTYKTKDGKMESRIVPCLKYGDAVTVPRSITSYVATEYGVVNLKGRSCGERAKLLISIAHPDFRDELEREAEEKNIIPKALRRRKR
ncbi:MAG: butyryl-CoA:acetate CoA-transferase domain-containing protein [Candidatus Methanolliviera sp. GoM_oil]|nr:MAG: butyryl-CoA:acetate CoA-transferase domain-containing protein [Candidatus Methanolliviera sp. GoM_oil]